ncbi:MAG: hypothetical protein K0U37_03445 [Gammaproteobacteria bacterium]|nr:hypothetical protein [Gammaproteobacteria bacterium]
MPINLIGAINIVLPEKPPKARAYSIKFENSLVPDIAKIDALIAAYNQASTNEKRLEALAVLEKAVDKMDRTYPDDVKSFFPDYHEQIHKNLFNAIKAERAALGVSPNEAALSFPEYLAIMDPDKADQLLRILLEPNFTQEKLADTLFAENEPGRDAFRQVLSRYEIETFSGHNSTNFKVLDKQTNKKSILKIDNRMGVPKDAVAHLRAHSMAGVFTADVSEREAMCTNPADGKRTTRTILFTEFHEAGDLKNDAKNQDTQEKKLDTVIYRYLQMARALEGIEQDGCCFTDMKNGNWLVDAFGELRVADKKGFLYTHEAEVQTVDEYGDPITKSIRVLDLNDEQNKFYAPCRSPHMSPPELATLNETQPAIDVNKMHAYMLGKDLYQYLSGCRDSAFMTFDAKGQVTGTLNDVDKLDFSADVFQTAKGGQLKHTIKQLINPDPDARITLHELVEALAFIEYPDLVQFSFAHEELVGLKIDVYQSLKGLEHFKINPEDPLMTAFILEQREAIENAHTEEALLSIQAELSTMQFMFRENHDQFLAIKDMIHTFKMGTSPGMAEKGAQIEEAVLAVPIIERTSIADGKTKPQKAVLKVMAKDASLFGRLAGQTVSGTPEPTNSKEAFVKFKEKFAKEEPKLDDAGLDDEQNIRPNNQ